MTTPSTASTRFVKGDRLIVVRGKYKSTTAATFVRYAGSVSADVRLVEEGQTVVKTLRLTSLRKLSKVTEDHASGDSKLVVDLRASVAKMRKDHSRFEKEMGSLEKLLSQLEIDR